MRLYTIGYEKKKPNVFFGILEDNHVSRVVDIRLRNTRGMITWLNKDELCYFLDRLSHIAYIHETRLSPTEEILALKDWSKYEPAFKALIASRHIETLRDQIHDGDCLLCYENDPAKCHRGLVASYFEEHWGDVDIVHLQTEAPRRAPRPRIRT